MQNNKINEIFDIDKIKEIVQWIYENLEYLQIEPFVKDRIDNILNGIESKSSRLTRGIIIFDDDDKAIDVTIILEEAWQLHEEEMLDYLESETQKNEQFFREKNADKIEKAHRIIDKNCDNEGKSLEERKKLHEEIDYNFESAILEMHEVFNREEKYRIVDVVATEKGLDKLLESIQMYMKESGIVVAKFCKMNDVSIEISTILFKIVYAHTYIGHSIVELFKWSIIQKTNLSEIIDCYGNWFKNEKDIGIKPQKEGFHWYLVDEANNLNKLFNDDILKKQLAKYVNLEVTKMRKLWQEIEEEQTLIDITPQQTLSIETTCAHVEEGKKKKVCLFKSLQIAIAVTMVNERTGLFPKKISKTDSACVKKFLKDIEEKFFIENVPTDQLFRHYANLQLSKEYLQNLSESNKKGVKKILELGGFTELLKDIK